MNTEHRFTSAPEWEHDGEPAVERSSTICQPLGVRAPDTRTGDPLPPTRSLADRIPLFGPHYTRCKALQAAVDHAERAYDVLRETNAELEAARRTLDGYTPSLVEEHLSTRHEELRAFVGSCVEDFLLGGTPGEVAAHAIERYLTDRVHDFLHDEFDRPACCEDPTRTATVTYTLASRVAPTPDALAEPVHAPSDEEEAPPSSVPPTLDGR